MWRTLVILPGSAYLALKLINYTYPVVNLIVRIAGYYTLQFCDYYMGMDQSEEEKYFLLLPYWLKSKGTFPLSL
jgi:hypothetical protein